VGASSSARDPKKENIVIGHKNRQDGDSSSQHKDHLGDDESYGKPTSGSVDLQDSNSASRSLATDDSSNSDIKLVNAIKALSVNTPMPSLVVNGSGAPGLRGKSDGIDGLSEDLFQRADSGSELGTKPPSLDGKSITSGTTFALDEKESLRPDDSASVKAADDDDAFSGRDSIVAGSRIGSEAAARAYRTQYYADERRVTQPVQERQSQGMNTPQSGSSGQQTTDDTKPKPLIDAAGTPDGFSLFYRQTPDEKLLEALDSPKDRIFLLRLEQSVIEFVKSSKSV
jgi:hypothetical protein